MQTSLCTVARLAASWAMLAGLAAGCASTAPSTPTAVTSPLVGSWRLTSFEMELQDSTDKVLPMGKRPAGYLSFLPDGRMAVVITAEGRKAATSDPERAALYSSLVAYAGRVRVDGNQWITTVDVAANPAWVGTEQPRTFKLDGDALHEVTPWFARPDKRMARVVNNYERVK